MTVAISPELSARIDFALAEVRAELERALAAHGPMRTGHRGYAVILGEVRELFDEVKANRGETEAAMREAIQIAAMAARNVVDLRR